MEILRVPESGVDGKTHRMPSIVSDGQLEYQISNSEKDELKVFREAILKINIQSSSIVELDEISSGCLFDHGDR